MTNFIQIHTLTPMVNVLVNSDDTRQAKRILLNNVPRIRISSQSLKRSWRDYKGPNSVTSVAIDAGSTLTRRVISDVLLPEIRDHSDVVITTSAKIFQSLLHSEKAGASTQMILLGDPEISYLKKDIVEVAEEIKNHIEMQDAEKKSKEEIQKSLQETLKNTIKARKSNLSAMRENSSLAAGIPAALFGRMMTSDPSANIHSSVSVAHSFTTHAEESESDFFNSIDDLDNKNNSKNPGFLSSTEITSNIFYGYSVIDVNTLLTNTGKNKEISSGIVKNLIHTIAEVNPAGRRTSTAPFSRAAFMLICAGDRQPMSYADAFRSPSKPNMESSIEFLEDEIQRYDAAFDISDTRKYLNATRANFNIDAEKRNLSELSNWAAELVLNND